jgi:D-alanyl-D-alanine carboxypeptidase
MLNIIANFIAIILSFWMPPLDAVYASGPWRGAEACLGANHLPANAERLAVSKPAPDVAAKSAAVLSDDGHLWLNIKEDKRRQPIASITKLMTALVFLDHNPGWEKSYTIKREDLVDGGKVNLFLGETILVKDLFNATLVASDNGATLALARSTNLSDSEFVAAMNDKAHSLGLMQTEFSDPIGLNNDNLSNVKDVARLGQIAFDRADIAAAVALSDYSFTTAQGQLKNLESTDWLLAGNVGEIEALGGKTGYTEQAGYCFVGRFRDSQGRSVIVAVLDAGTKNDRFRQARLLATWSFTYCQW